MNAQQRRTQRRAVRRQPASLGCHAQGRSGTTSYPDLMCTDGYMSDMDADGDDPSVARPPCASCNPEEHAEWLREQRELEEE
jgi:hypothetical protein